VNNLPNLDNVKAILDIPDNSKDNVLTLYLNRATNFVKGYCNLTELNPTLEEVVEDIAVFKYRNKGVENIVSEGKGSLSESYRDGLPPQIIDTLNEHRRLKFL
jgi:hypothetical protein